MKKKHEPARRIVSLDEALEHFGQNARVEDVVPQPKPEEKPMAVEEVKKPAESKPAEKPKGESLNKIKRKIEEIKKAHMEHLPPATRIPTTKDIKTWIVNNPSLNINSPQFLSWIRCPDNNGLNPYVEDFGKIMTELGIDYICDADVKGYVYDFYIPDMSLYIDIDPISLETDNPKDKINITVDKNRIDVLGVWRTINESREARCKPYRFLAIKERVYAQGVSEFLSIYTDWYYQKICNASK